MDYWILLIIFFLIVDKTWHLTGTLAAKLNSSDKLQQLLNEKKQLQHQQQQISAQDQYALWTKNNRKLDKLDKNIEEAKKSYVSGLEATNARLAKLKILLVTVPFTALKFYKGKLHVYSVPKGMFPSVIEGILEHGWIYMALAPMKFRQVSEGAVVTVTLGIWLFALLKVISACEFIVEVLREPTVYVGNSDKKSVDVDEKGVISQPVD
ncbi:HFR006Cp [Eremothecium sinecaudum]|uniref:Golgi to ER traffic protein 1 n=1 Tax=Eremothecium sinecaudum TaxID=45286 RepID=A0A0X8HUQ0_9SACH|nr:HFR006Cp [Eremothecium sinecaudum]AMD21861.1 HFR006Cp [Eremothecium sinecaudum]